jgi:hypothetical protein
MGTGGYAIGIRKIITIYNDPTRHSHSAAGARLHWLTGIVVCARCDTTMQTTNLHHVGVYRCVCGLNVNRTHLESLVSTWLFTRARDARPPVPTLPDANAVDRETRLAELAALYVAREISRSEWDAARSVLPATQPVSVVPEEYSPRLREAWPELPVGQRHSVASRYLTAVRIAPALRHGSFDARRATPTWRV